MSRFNAVKEKRTHDTTNRAGGRAYEQSPKLAFASMIVTFMAQNQYYRSATQGIEELRDLISEIPTDFAAKAAIYSRHYVGLRSVSHILAAEIAHDVSGEEWGRVFYRSVIGRPDDVLEILAYYAAHVEAHGNGIRGVTSAMKKGLGDALASFDEYELDKYARRRHEISLHDAINVLHPPYTEAIDALVNGEIETADTWEKRKTEAGQSDEEDSKQVWSDLLESGKLGYMATLRNLRNIAQDADTGTLELALNVITDEERIENSKMLPFRFTTAIDAIEDAAIPQRERQAIYRALSDAVDASLSNVPEFPGRSLILVDVSGSMKGDSIEKASLFASIMYRAWESSDLMTFSRRPHWFHPLKEEPTLSIARQLQEMGGGGTDLNAPFEEIRKDEREYDRIFILSDMQAWKGQAYTGRTAEDGFNSYRSALDVDPFLYCFDFDAYGSMQFPEEKVFCIAGLSSSVFDVMELLEEDREALISEIESIDL